MIVYAAQKARNIVKSFFLKSFSLKRWATNCRMPQKVKITIPKPAWVNIRFKEIYAIIYFFATFGVRDNCFAREPNDCGTHVACGGLGYGAMLRSTTTGNCKLVERGFR